MYLLYVRPSASCTLMFAFIPFALSVLLTLSDSGSITCSPSFKVAGNVLVGLCLSESIA